MAPYLQKTLIGERENHIFCGQLIAIVELDALTQLEFNGLVIKTLPFGRKTRNRALIAHPVTQDETFPQIREEDTLANIRLLVPDVERVVVGDLLHRDRDRAALVGANDTRQDESAGSSSHQTQCVTTINKHALPRTMATAG